MTVVISPDLAGLTIKNYISKHIPGLSRRILIEMKKRQDGICVNGERVTVRYLLKEGDVLTLLYDDIETGDIVPTEMPLVILYEDEDLIAINKPAPMPTHPSMGHYTDTLANGLTYYFREKPFIFRVLNRLDSVTSGIVLVAKNRLASARLSASLREGEFEKHYYAIVQGYIEEPAGTVDHNIKRALPSIISRCVCDKDEGERALTTYRALSRSAQCSFLDCFPHTGRTHQLRVHLASIAHPILGDFLYGKEDDRLPERVALHLGRLSFPHPSSGENLTIHAPLPDEMQDILDKTMQEELI